MRRGGLVLIATALLGCPSAARAASASASTRPFAFAGVIEGSYGPTWSHTDRSSTISWMAGQGLDTYIHAPKFDAYQRAQWRQPYPAQDMADFASEIRLANGTGVAWVPNISPGFPLIPGAPAGADVSRDVCFSCPDDVNAVVAKLTPFFDAGARMLMVSFDDVQKVSSHPEDLATYGQGAAAYGHMTRDLLNAVQRHFQARAGRTPFTLMTVLADYSGTADTAYLQGVRAGHGLDTAIRVLWTGTTVVAPTIRAVDAGAYARLVGRRRVGIWDNYPANDYTGNIAGRAVRLFLGPYEGRDRRLASSVSGIVTNVMNEAVPSRFALATLARYATNPVTYRPEAAWRDAIAALADGRSALADALAAFAENSRSSALNRTESVALTTYADALERALVTPFWLSAYDRLGAELERERRAPMRIATGFPALAAQASPFLSRLEAQAGTAQMAADVLAAQRPALHATTRRGRRGTVVSGSTAPPSLADAIDLLTTLEARHGADLADPHFVHGDRFTPSLSDSATTATVYVNQNRVDAFVAAVRSLTATWLPSATAATSGIALTLDGHAVPVAADGAFTVSLPRDGRRHALVATDGAGHATGLRVAG